MISIATMISIIIPTYNEADQVSETIKIIMAASVGTETEIIIADGGSTDNTIVIAQTCGVRTVTSKAKGRAAQMNEGASIAKGEIFYFLHADSIPPANFLTYITAAIDAGKSCGCFRLAFDYQHWFLKTNCWFTRFDINAVRFGDQSLFVTRAVFTKSGGFREDLIVMEDQEIIHRLKRHGKFIVMKAAVITSARKYHDNGIYKMQVIFFRIWLLYYLGYSQPQILKVYRSLIKKHKL